MILKFINKLRYPCLFLVCSTALMAAPVSISSIYQDTGTETDTHLTDVIISTTGGTECIWMEDDAKRTITVNNGDGTLFMKKEGAYAALQVGNAQQTDITEFTLNGSLNIDSTSRSYDSTGDFQAVSAKVYISGDVSITRQYPLADNPDGRVTGAASIFQEGGRIDIDGNVSLTGSACQDTTKRGGAYAAVWIAQGNANYSARVDLVLGIDDTKTIYIHDYTFNTAGTDDKDIQLHGFKTEGVIWDTVPLDQAFIKVNGNTVIENMKATITNKSSDSMASVIGAEAVEQGRIEFNAGLIIRGLEAEGPKTEIYSLSAIRGGVIQVNEAADAKYVTQITGDMRAYYSGNETESVIEARFLNENSWFEGVTLYGSGTETAGTINLDVKDGAQWYVTRDCYLNGVLDLQDGNVHLGSTKESVEQKSDFGYGAAAGYTTLTLKELKGNGGVFHLRTHIDDDLTDHVAIQQGSGNHELAVRSTGVEPSAERTYSPMVTLYSGNADFTLVGGKVDAGLYSYTILKEDRTDGSGIIDWYLERSGVEPDPEREPDPLVPVIPTPDYSEAGGTVLGISSFNVNYAMWNAHLSDLRKRLGEVRDQEKDNALSFRGFHSDYDLDGMGGTSLEQSVYGYALGYERLWKVDSDQAWLLGLEGSWIRANQKVNGYRGKGRNEATGFLLSGTWLHNDGWYADNVLGMQFYDQDISVTQADDTLAKGGYRNTGIGAGIEVGRKFKTRNCGFIEPQAQISWYWRDSTSYNMSNGMHVNMGDTHALSTRLGVVMGRTYNCEKIRTQPYLLGGVIQEFLGNHKGDVNGIGVGGKLNGARCYYGAGIDVFLKDNIRLYGQAGAEKGNHYDRNWYITAGVAFSW